MKINHSQLSTILAQGLASTYLVSGDEPLLVQEACDEIKASAKRAGFDERELFHADAGFNWNALRDEANSLSLFANKRVLEIRINNGKPSDKGEVLKALIERPSADNLLLIVCPRLDATMQKTAWVKAVENQGVLLPIWPLERNQYPAWLKSRFTQAGLQIDPDALTFLAQQTEGNLLAAVQEIEKLRLLNEPNIHLALVQDATSQSARFDAFQLADSALQGKLGDALRMLQQQHSEGTEAILLLAALVRKIRQLIQLKNIPTPALSDAFRRQGIWPKQQAAYQHALKKLSIEQLHVCLGKAEEIDNAVKGSGDDAWRLLSELITRMAGYKF